MDKCTRVIFLCDWLPPDFGAVGQYEFAAARQQARLGQFVTLVGFSSQKNSEESDPETEGRLIIRRIHRPTYSRSTWIRRAIWTLRSNLSLVWRARQDIRDADEIRFTGSPPFMMHFVMPVAAVLGKRTRYRISDFHPECLIAALGHAPWWIRPIQALTQYWRKRVTVFEVLGEDQKRRLLDQGIPESRIELKRDSTPIRITGQEEGRLRPPEMDGRFVLLYSGNWGRAHDSETFIRAVKGLGWDVKSKLGIWLNCIGKESREVFEQLNLEPGVIVKRSRPYPLADLPEVLASADCHLITLKNAFVGYVLPSKVYGCIASGKPILYVGSRDSDVHLLCQRQAAGRYHQVDCGDWVQTGKLLETLVNRQRQ